VNLGTTDVQARTACGIEHHAGSKDLTESAFTALEVMSLSSTY
jgi:hypothetical protein